MNNILLILLLYSIYNQKKANLNEKNVIDLFEWLSKPPKWTTIRVNKIKIDSNESLNHVQNFINDVIKMFITNLHAKIHSFFFYFYSSPIKT